MPDIIMLVDSAVTVPVNIFPLTDDTDFKTRETSVAYNQSGLDLIWNFVTAAGVQTHTAVTPTDTGGNYDWVNIGHGMYNIEIPASGGASINNDTEGFGWFTGFATGILPWRSPVIQFSPANVVNSLVTGSDILDVSVTQWNGTAVHTPGTAGIPVVDVHDVTFPTNFEDLAIVDTTGTVSLAATPPTVAQIRTEMDSNSTQLAAIVADTNELQTDWANGGRLDLILDGRSTITEAQVNAQCDAALLDYDPATGTESAAIKTIVDKVDGAMELDGAVYRFTTNALENSPTGTGGFTSGDRATLEGIATGISLKIGNIIIGV